MKNILFILISLPFLLFGQSPQGVGYQAVATDLNGVELINQTISIQASVISSSATGNIEWQEEHSVSTDAFGLFALTIGQGTSTGNGAQASFADISWGSATHFLKMEIDVNGGTNYSLMVTNQMMSVPYALYAESSGTTGIGNTIWQQDSLNNISYNLGKVGIASADPKENFQIGDRWFFHNGVTKAITYNHFWNGNNWEYSTSNPSSGIEFNMGNTGAVSIYTSQTGIAGTPVSGLSQKLTVLNDGKVGIGTTTPTHTLEVISPSINARTFKIRRNENIPGYGAPIDFHLLNSLNQDVQYGMIAASIKDSAAGAEIGFLSLQVADGSGSFGQNYQQERLRVENDRVTIKTVMKLQPLSTAPINASKGDIYMDNTTNKLMVYDGTIWQACW